MHRNIFLFIRLIDFLVRDNDSIKHYRIRQTEDGRFFIARRISFYSLSELVTHYIRISDGLCMSLRKPCVHVRRIRISLFDFEWEICRLDRET